MRCNKNCTCDEKKDLVFDRINPPKILNISIIGSTVYISFKSNYFIYNQDVATDTSEPLCILDTTYPKNSEDYAKLKASFVTIAQSVLNTV